MKLGGIVSLLGSITGEFVGSDAGVGYLIVRASNNYNVKLLFANLIAVTILGRLIYFFVCFVEKHAISWHVSMRSERERIFVS
jgi:NitT/TauT family transport system permease protein